MTLENTAKIPAVEHGVGKVGGSQILGLVGGRLGLFQIEHDAQVFGAVGAQGVNGRAVGIEHMMHGARGGALVAVAGSMGAEIVAEIGDAPGLVDGRGGFEPVAEFPGNQRGVVGEPAGNVAVHPAAPVLQRGRQIPVVKRGVGLDAAFEHAIDQTVVKVETSLVDATGSLGDQSRPGKREAIGIKAAIADQIEVLGPELIMIAGNRAGIAIVHIAGRRREAVPDRRTAAILLATLDLIGGGGDAECEIGPKVLAVDRKHLCSSAASSLCEARR